MQVSQRVNKFVGERAIGDDYEVEVALSRLKIAQCERSHQIHPSELPPEDGVNARQQVVYLQIDIGIGGWLLPRRSRLKIVRHALYPYDSLCPCFTTAVTHLDH